jgi:hypothetical protein
MHNNEERLFIKIPTLKYSIFIFNQCKDFSYVIKDITTMLLVK